MDGFNHSSCSWMTARDAVELVGGAIEAAKAIGCKPGRIHDALRGDDKRRPFTMDEAAALDAALVFAGHRPVHADWMVRRANEASASADISELNPEECLIKASASLAEFHMATHEAMEDGIVTHNELTRARAPYLKGLGWITKALAAQEARAGRL